MRIKLTLVMLMAMLAICINVNAQNLQIGAYYFDGWATDKSSAFTDELLTQFPEREPIWGWRDDDIKIMERQIDIASENGVDFFAFCWYWADDLGTFNEKAVKAKPAHTSLDLFMKAKNKHKMKFCLLIANHDGARIQGEENWRKAVDYFAEAYFTDPQYLNIDSKPVLVYFIPKDAHPHINAMQEEARIKGYAGLYNMSCGYNLSGFDALTWYNSFDGINKSKGYPYGDLCLRMERMWGSLPEGNNVAPLCMAGWDKRPWEVNENSAYYVWRSPERFRKQLYRAVDCVHKQKNKIILIYAWNEYGEGGYIAPTKGDRKGRFLKQVKKAKEYAKRRK